MNLFCPASVAVEFPATRSARERVRYSTQRCETHRRVHGPFTDTCSAHSCINVTLAQPCIIRNPSWRFVDCGDGTTIKADNATVVGNNTIIFEFEDVIPATVAFVEPPYQDVEVQNFQGGFVRPGGQWFRKAS